MARGETIKLHSTSQGPHRDLSKTRLKGTEEGLEVKHTRINKQSKEKEVR